MIHLWTWGGRTILQLRCDDCSGWGPRLPAPAKEEDWDIAASRRARPLGWTEVKRHTGNHRGYIASLCPKCSGVKVQPPQLQLQLKIGRP